MHLFFFMVYIKKKVSGKEYCSWEVLYIFLPLNVSLPNQRPNKMKLSPFLLFQLLYISTATEPEREVVDFKIVEGLPKPKTTYTSSSTPIKPTPSREPNGVPQNTPIEFSALDGKCFSERIGKYMYEVWELELTAPDISAYEKSLALQGEIKLDNGAVFLENAYLVNFVRDSEPQLSIVAPENNIQIPPISNNIFRHPLFSYIIPLLFLNFFFHSPTS